MNYQFFSSFISRTPFFPFNHLRNFSRDRDDLFRLFGKEFQEAIYIASPVLYKELMKFLNNKLTGQSEIDRLISSLERYLSRMSTRSTPFGLFAGCAVGNIVPNGQQTKTILSGDVSKTVRLDMFYLSELSQYLSQIQEIKESIRYYPNSSFYLLGKKCRYVESEYVGSKRLSRISSVTWSLYLDKILKFAYNGGTIKELCKVIQYKDITQEEAIEFIFELIESQILMGELLPSVTGIDYLEKIINILDSAHFNDSNVKHIKNVHSLLKRLSTEKEDAFGIYNDLLDKIKTIGVKYNEDKLLQVDTAKKIKESSLGTEVLDEIKSAAAFLNRITPAMTNPVLDNFKKAFLNRYEEREVPLMEVLDPEMGIGYPAGITSGDDHLPLLNNFPLPQNQRSTSVSNNSLYRSILLKKTISVLSKGEKEILFSDSDIKDFPKSNWEDLPAVTSCMIELIRANPGDILLKLNSFGGGGANLLARFSHTDDKISHFVQEITQKEQELMPDVILAEIAHLPESRIGNIISRPHVREYEIPYMVNSELPIEKQIHLSDLMVSVKQDNLVLRSKKLKKEIIPRLTNAHNYNRNPTPIYHFLCEIQYQKKRNSLFFDWGSIANDLSFLPRVRYKNVILSPATWLIKVEDMKHLFDIKDDDQQKEAIRLFCTENEFPMYVLLQDGDNELFVDWTNNLSICSLFSIIKKRVIVKFTEFLFEPENAIFRDEKGNGYLNECIVVLFKSNIK